MRLATPQVQTGPRRQFDAVETGPFMWGKPSRETEYANGVVRTMVAKVCAGILAATTNPAVAAAALTDLLDNEDECVRRAAAEVAMGLRGGI